MSTSRLPPQAKHALSAQLSLRGSLRRFSLRQCQRRQPERWREHVHDAAQHAVLESVRRRRCCCPTRTQSWRVTQQRADLPSEIVRVGDARGGGGLRGAQRGGRGGNRLDVWAVQHDAPTRCPCRLEQVRGGVGLGLGLELG